MYEALNKSCRTEMATLYQPNQTDSFKFSRTKLELFIECPHCFYLDRRLGISQPFGPAFTLNIAVDTLMKKECDGYRAQQRPHPITVEYKVDAIPYQPTPPELIETWRNNFKGISFHHTPTNFLVYGAIDDIWVNPKGELIIIDYKATSKAGEVVLDQDYHDAYRRQLDIYAWLFKMNTYPVHDKAYWVYCNGIKDGETFENCLHFKTVLIEHPVDTTWIESKLMEAHQCLNQSKPPARTDNCQFCKYLTSVESLSLMEKFNV